MFYGRNGSSARITFYSEDANTVDSATFWPDGVIIRKWLSQTEWERTRSSRRPFQSKPLRSRYGKTPTRYRNVRSHCDMRHDYADDDYDYTSSNERHRDSSGHEQTRHRFSYNDSTSVWDSNRDNSWDPDYD